MKTNTKIIATLGPSCFSQNIINKMVSQGANIFRLNMSHGDKKSKNQLYDIIKKVQLEDGNRPTILTDLCGPKIRIKSDIDQKIISKNFGSIYPYFRTQREK